MWAAWGRHGLVPAGASSGVLSPCQLSPVPPQQSQLTQQDLDSRDSCELPRLHSRQLPLMKDERRSLLIEDAERREERFPSERLLRCEFLRVLVCDLGQVT